MLRATLAASRRLARPAILAAGAGATLAASAPLSSCASKQEKPLTLVYFSVRAMAECPRMILEYGNIAYEDVGPTTWFGVGWKDAKKLTPFNQLPLLFRPGRRTVAHSAAIARAIAAMAHQSGARPGYDMNSTEGMAAATEDAYMMSRSASKPSSVFRGSPEILTSGTAASASNLP